MIQNVELSLEERKKVQLEMLKEVDTFCRQNNIKYTLSCGTLIGAIRHKGFIPWDDDVDITMPFDDMVHFLKIFKSDKIEICDAFNTPGYFLPFPRLANTESYSIEGKGTKTYGICIDVYPIFECISNPTKLKTVIAEAQKIWILRNKLIHWRAVLLRYISLPRMNLPIFTPMMKKYQNFLVQELSEPGSGIFYQIGGLLTIFEKNKWNFNPFEEIIDVEFEGYKFCAPKRYDEFLKVRYGNYMSLPPENQRHPYHAEKFYWK